MRKFNSIMAMAVVAFAAAVPGATLAADYNWTFQTSETAGEPGFVNKTKWAEEVGRLSGDRIAIEILPIGAVVPHTDTLDAVGAGILQGHLTDPSYFAGKDPAFSLMGNLVGAWSDPFELLGYMQSGGGNELYRELVEPYGVHFIGAAATEAEAFDLYASRHWALRTLWETTYEGESPIADPDLAMVEPERYTPMSAPQLRGKSLPPNLLHSLYHDAAQNLLEAWHNTASPDPRAAT